MAGFRDVRGLDQFVSVFMGSGGALPSALFVCGEVLSAIAGQCAAAAAFAHLAAAKPAHYLRRMTENRQLTEELLRGGIAVTGLVLGSSMLQHQPVIALFLFIAAIVAVRGCAFCYLYGLFGAAKSCAIRPKPMQSAGPK